MRPQRGWAPSASERAALRRVVDAGEGGTRAKRASAVLLAAEGLEHREIGERVGLAPPTVSRWVARFQREGIGGLADRSRRRKKIADEIAAVDIDVLVSWASAEDLPEDVRRRARALVLLTEGMALKDICRTVGVSGPILWKWRNRYRERGVHGLRPREADAVALPVPATDRASLEAWAREASPDSAVPARIILLAAEGETTHGIATRVGRSPTAVRNWLAKYRDGGLGRIRPSAVTHAHSRIDVLPEQRASLVRWLERPDVLVDEAATRRGRAVLLAAEGVRIKDIAGRFQVQPGSVGEWLRRYRADGVAGLESRRGGRRPKHDGLELPAEERDVLQLWADSRVLKPPVVRRARAVLLTADGEPPSNVAVWSRMSPGSVVKWVDRYLAYGPGTLLGPEPGASSEVDEPRLVLTTLESPRELVGTRLWNPESLSGVLERVGPGTVAKTWSRWGLRPSRAKPWRFAANPKIVLAEYEIIGLYLNPPDRVLVLGSGTPAVESLRSLRAELQSAATAPVSGKGRWHERHLRFLEELSRRYPEHLRLLCEPAGAQHHPRVVEWLARYPRISVHLPPSSVSWRNFVTAWLGIAARRFHDREKALELSVRLVADLDNVPRSAEFTWFAHTTRSGRATRTGTRSSAE